ncbi:MAG: isoprenyl transferase [Clostridia bacterium]|nr:isoprenyl transferase [Clostridia bacterium]MBQ1376326.1 isoprenyl transferase [Clostridia bacterium]
MDNSMDLRIGPDNPAMPKHIGIIMDGNGRWAKKRGLPRSAGHKEGAKTFKKISEYCQKIGIKYLTVYAFSTENWKRPEEEIEGIFALLHIYIWNERARLIRDRAALKFIGDMSRFSPAIMKDINMIERDTGMFDDLHINVAINYGGRQDIVHAAKVLAKKVKDGEITEDDITEESFGRELYTGGMPDPDLIIRPSGELRLSNFLLYQGAYSELWFSDIMWPDFSPADLDNAIIDYMKRNRRFGGL